MRKLTITEIDNLKPRAKAYLEPTEIKNLFVRVLPSGHKAYHFSFRFPRGREGQQRTISHGCDQITVKQIATNATRWNGLLADGIDPRAQREAADKEALRAFEAETFDDVAQRYLREHAKVLRTATEIERTLTVYILPTLGKLKIADVRRKDVQGVVDGVKVENGPVMAHRCYMTINAVLRWWETKDEHYTIPNLRKVSEFKWKQNERKHVLTDREVKTLWDALETMPRPFGPMVKFMLLTAQRRDEVAHVRWDEIDGDKWVIPPERAKMGSANVVPLSKLARDVLDQMGKPQKGKLVFPTSGGSTFSNFSRAKVALDKAMERIAGGPVADWRLHDIRRSCRTLMARAGVPSDIAELALGHKKKGVRAVYDQFSYLPQIAHAFDALAAEIERILTTDEGDNVVPLRRSNT